MAGLIPQSFIDDLLNRTDIVEVVSSRIQLKKAGKNYTACCPFHKEKTPSFSVSPDKQFYYCFGCGAGGKRQVTPLLQGAVAPCVGTDLCSQECQMRIDISQGGLGERFVDDALVIHRVQFHTRWRHADGWRQMRLQGIGNARQRDLGTLVLTGAALQFAAGNVGQGVLSQTGANALHIAWVQGADDTGDLARAGMADHLECVADFCAHGFAQQAHDGITHGELLSRLGRNG